VLIYQLQFLDVLKGDKSGQQAKSHSDGRKDDVTVT